MHRLRPGSKSKTRADGFSIVETLVALLLLCIVLAGTMAMQATVIRTSTDSRVTSAAMTLAQSRIEQFRSAAFVDGTPPLATDWDEPPISPAYFKLDLTAGTSSDYFFSRTSTLSTTAGVVELTVTVVWLTSTGQQQIRLAVQRTVERLAT